MITSVLNGCQDALLADRGVVDSDFHGFPDNDLLGRDTGNVIEGISHRASATVAHHSVDGEAEYICFIAHSFGIWSGFWNVEGWQVAL